MPEEHTFDQIPEVMSRLGTDLLVRAQNRLSRDKYGDVGGKPCHEAHFGRSEPCPGCQVDEVLKRRRTGHWYLTDDSGEKPSYYEVTVAPILDGDGRLVELVEIIRDATVSFAVEQHLIRTSEELEGEVARRSQELKELTSRTTELREQLQELKQDQAALVQTEKMASVGRLAAGLTHEIHTPLGALISNLDMLQRCVGKAGDSLQGGREGGQAGRELGKLLATCRELLDMQKVAAERIHKIVRSLRNFAHLDRAEEESYDVHEGIDAALALLFHETKGRIEITRDYGSLPPVLCKPDALNQVFMNLLQNAVSAIEGAGRIRIVTKLDNGNEAVLEFHDSGKGIDTEHLERIFDPGYTTKPRGVGTGLGLAIAHRTMASHGGSITVHSELGKGTVFTLRLPVCGKAS